MGCGPSVQEKNATTQPDAQAPAAAAVGETLIITLPKDSPTVSTIPLTPYDLINGGRSTPMIWFYEETLSKDKLITSLRTLLLSFPVLCGRYSPSATSPPTAVELNNAGVPVSHKEFNKEPEAGNMTLKEAVAHLSTEQTSTFERSAPDSFLPPLKGIMDPDTGNAEAPLIAIQLNFWESGGTAIGILVQHYILDAEAPF